MTPAPKMPSKRPAPDVAAVVLELQQDVADLFERVEKLEAAAGGAIDPALDAKLEALAKTYADVLPRLEALERLAARLDEFMRTKPLARLFG